MKSPSKKSIFKTDQRIRLGIWGLGRGMSFYQTCAALNIDVVAGCDFNPHMRERFLRDNPGAFVTDDARKFLEADFDAVLLATFCPGHADDAIACLNAGKHVLSEVTAFHTMAEGVRLVEKVEKSGRVYNMVENYPFTAANMYLARKWREGLFGDLMYAEYEYNHEILSLSYTYIDGQPITRGDTVHHWRSWLNFHYYCTHSLGPMMYITGTRPTRVVALPGVQKLPGHLMGPGEGMGGIAPSLIHMSNGAVVRNLMGATTNDTHIRRLWGTLGSAEYVDGALRLRLGGGGSSPKFEVTPKWDELGQIAARTGHGGGDFWVLYFFARQILEGIPAPFDIYAAADCTIPGILACRSQKNNGKPYDVPDFRNPEEREPYRNDHDDQPRYDVERGVFLENTDNSLNSRFSRTMKDLIGYARMCRAWRDWSSVKKDMVKSVELMELVVPLVHHHEDLHRTYRLARRMADANPGSDGAKVLSEMLALGEEKIVMAPGFLAQLKRHLSALRRRYPKTATVIRAAESSPLLPGIADIRRAVLPGGKIAFQPILYLEDEQSLSPCPSHDGKNGLVYVRAVIRMATARKGRLLYGANGPVKAWFNRTMVGCHPNAAPSTISAPHQSSVRWKKGINEIFFAILTRHDRACRVTARVEPF